MNKNIINKCLAELTKDIPDLSYIRGMLETLSELDNDTKVIPQTTQSIPNSPTFAQTNTTSTAGDYVKSTGPLSQLH